VLNDLLKNPDILKIIAAPLVGLVPVLINILINWMDKRSHASKRNAELVYVNQRVSFLTNWYNVQQQVGDPVHLPEIKKQLADELRDVYSDFTAALIDADNLTKQRDELIARVKNTNAFRRFFLLYAPYNAAGWLYHTLYYMVLIPLFVVIGIVGFQYEIQNVQIDPLFLQIGVGLIILVLIFRSLGRRAAKPEEQRLATIDRKTSPLGRTVTTS
jgi:4-amino-4-deoxy-L-arabinose transferase-like glycosyltransferase